MAGVLPLTATALSVIEATEHPDSFELALCAMVTMDYEGPYLLPWLTYHRLLGFDRVLLLPDQKRWSRRPVDGG